MSLNSLLNTFRFSSLALLVVISSTSYSFAIDLRFGGAIGYGGAGISGNATVNSTPIIVSRSEGPLIVALSVDTLLSDSISIGIEHSRGVQIGPFSSGVSFTGPLGRWYFRTPAPSVGKRSTLTRNQILIQRFDPFLGLGVGIANGNVTRSDDQVQELKGSGLFIGYRAGADYQISPGLGLRPELVFASTLSSPTPLVQFSLQLGIFTIP